MLTPAEPGGSLPFLSNEALAHLTGYRQKSKQIKQLRTMGVPFRVNAAGRPVVAASAVRQNEQPTIRPVPARTPEAGRRYAGSALQKFHQAQREAAEQMAADRQAEAQLLAPAFELDRRERHAALVRHHEGKRRAAQLQRTPPWADMGAIRAVYAEAAKITRETGVEHHVDHVLPLQGRLVSGLHVHTNLQILTAAENSRKRNRFEPC